MSLDVANRRESLQTVRQYQSEVAEIREGPEPLTARLTVHTLSVMMVATAAILTFAKTDRVVTTADGLIVTSQPEKVIQALDPSIIKTLDVKAGEHVAKGQLLVTLDPTFAASAVDQLQWQISSLQAEIARDVAEISAKPLQFPDSKDARFPEFAKINKDLYEQQEALFHSQINSFDQQIAQTKATIVKYQVDEARYKERVTLNTTIEGMYTVLAAHGNGPQLNKWQAQDAETEITRDMEFDHNSVTESQHALAALEANREAAIQQFLTAASQDLATSQTTLSGAQAQLDAALRHKELVRVTADEDSYILSVANMSPGSVLVQGATLITLVPSRVPLEAQIKVSPQDIGFVRKGDPVTMKIDAFYFAEHGTVSGTVVWIGQDAISPEVPLGQPVTPPTSATVASTGAIQPAMNLAYYEVKVSIDKMNLVGVPASARLTPGMTLEGDIKVGSRSLGSYIVGGLVHFAGDSMREP